MPVLPDDASEREKREAAERADRAARAEESQWITLALALWAAERALIDRRLAEARTPAEALAVLAAARRAYIAPDGLFVREWVRRVGPLVEASVRDAIRRHALERGLTPPARSAPLPPEARAVVEARARELAQEVARTSARPVAAAERLVADLVARPVAAPAVPPVLPPAGRRFLTGAAGFAEEVWAQRLATLEPLLGKQLAAEVISSARRGAALGASVEKVALSVMRQARSSGKIQEARAMTIARTESHGAARAGEHAAALAAGSTKKLWVAILDDVLRPSHRRCHAQGPIPIDAVFSNGLSYPGERPAPASEVINCRCVLAYSET